MRGGAEIKGWCPGALRPMESGDGWVVRVRPFGGRLRRAQADGLAALSVAHGNGIIDLSSRGNIQLRGVREDSHTPLIEGLGGLRLLDASPEAESRRNIIVTPFWQPGEEGEMLSAELTDALAQKDAPDIPGKFGFAVDTGTVPVLQDASADIRIERDAGGGLILVADGMSTGMPVSTETAVGRALDLARWFLDRRGSLSRMATLVEVTAPDGHIVPRQEQNYRPAPGHTPQGALVGLAFGQMKAETLSALAKHGGMRMTPWRMMLVESARNLPEIDGLITDPQDPLLRVVACVGAPRCGQGLGDTHETARILAPHTASGSVLHVSGCPKGCAHPKAAKFTVVTCGEVYDLVENGKASDAPSHSGLSKQSLIRAI